MANNGFRKVSIETLKSARDVVGTVREGHIDADPTVGHMFYMYRPNGQYMRTNVVKSIIAQSGGEGVTTVDFETDSGSQYRLKIQQNDAVLDLPQNLN